MALPSILTERLRLPVVASPLFIISHPALTLAQCKAGVVGTFPALNARPESQLDEWLAMITEDLAAHNAANPERPAAPFAVNQIVHTSNKRLERDLMTTGQKVVRVPPKLMAQTGASACTRRLPLPTHRQPKPNSALPTGSGLT